MVEPGPANAGAVKDGERSAVAPTLIQRMQRVLSIAVLHGQRNLVLGAWGCGVFRNDPQMVAQEFRSFILEDPAFAGAFDRVVFAILDWSPEKRFIGPFEKTFDAERKC